MMSITASVAQDLANHRTDMVLLYSEASYTSRECLLLLNRMVLPLYQGKDTPSPQKKIESRGFNDPSPLSSSTPRGIKEYSD